LRIDAESKKIGLSARAVGKDDEPIVDTKVYSSQAGSGMASLGELADFGLGRAEPKAAPEPEPVPEVGPAPEPEPEMQPAAEQEPEVKPEAEPEPEVKHTPEPELSESESKPDLSSGSEPAPDEDQK